MPSDRHYGKTKAPVKKLADGGDVSPYSLKGIGRSISGAADDISNAKDSFVKKYMPDRDSHKRSAPAPASDDSNTPKTQLGGMNLSVIQKRLKDAGAE